MPRLNQTISLQPKIPSLKLEDDPNFRTKSFENRTFLALNAIGSIWLLERLWHPRCSYRQAS